MPWQHSHSFTSPPFAGSMNPRKRQRRQSAALVVQSSLQSLLIMGKKSTAQPRPKVNVPPRGIGPISEPNENDVLCGRGGRINAHEGNVRFRDLIHKHKKEYLAKETKKLEKAHIAKRLVDSIRGMNPPGRFLKEDPNDGMWYDIGDLKAIKKTGQALREEAPGIRKELDGDDDEDDDDEDKESPPCKAAASNNHKTQVSSRPPATATVTPNEPPLSQAPSAGYGYSSAQQQQQQTWSPNQDPRGGAYGTAPIGEDVYNSIGEEAPVYHPYRARVTPQYDQPSPRYSNVPSQMYSGLAGAVKKSSKVLSPKAQEVMRYHSSGSGSGPPPSQVAFGRVFAPTVLSSGSTMSSMSGLSGLSQADTHAFSGSGTSDVAGRGQRGDMYGHAPMSLASTSRENPRSAYLRRSAGQGSTPGSTSIPMSSGLQMSQLSDMTTQFSLGSLGRSSSLPDLGMNDKDMSLGEESLAALMEEDRQAYEHIGRFKESPKTSSGTSGSSGMPSIPPRARATSQTSAGAMSWASVGSQRSSSVRSKMVESVGSDSSPWNDESSRSVFSDLSADILALDLASDSRM